MVTVVVYPLRRLGIRRRTPTTMALPPELVYEMPDYGAMTQSHGSSLAHPQAMAWTNYLTMTVRRKRRRPAVTGVGILVNVDHVLTTERLVLRPVTAHDHAGLLTHWTLPDVRRFLFDGEALSAAEVTDTIQDSTRDFAAVGYGIWLIQEEHGTALVGTTGLRPLEDGLEIFYSLAPGSWG